MCAWLLWFLLSHLHRRTAAGSSQHTRLVEYADVFFISAYCSTCLQSGILYWRSSLLHMSAHFKDTRSAYLFISQLTCVLPTLYYRSLRQNLGLGSSNNGFTWPIPQITGVRPPVGELGKPAGTTPAQQICDTQQFNFGMIFGPLVPAACGIFEVRSQQWWLPRSPGANLCCMQSL